MLYEFAGQPFAVLAVECRGDRTGARRIVEENDYSFTVLFDTERIHSRDYRVIGFPVTFILDRDGNIVFRHVGYYPGMEVVVENEVRELLGLAAGKEQ